MSVVHAVCRAMERIAPLHLAESWDNVGLLLEAAKPRALRKVLLTIDLTPQVLAVCLPPDDPNAPSVIVSYHPPIFSGLKKITLSNPLQKSLLTCAREGISIYTPHTALDSCEGGVNHWLAEGLRGKRHEPLESGGRIVTLAAPTSMQDLAKRIKLHLNMTDVDVASPMSKLLISTVALCAGSGGDVLKGVEADCYLTGEMGHHDVLAAVASGKYVFLCGHTNTERGYLPVLQSKLLQELAKDSDGEAWSVGISPADEHPLKLV